MRATAEAGDHRIVVDEPESAGGTDAGPQPTDLLLASAASCFTLALAYAARKRRIELSGVRVTATGTYDGPRFSHIALSVTSDDPRETLETLLPAAERLCYVTNTLRDPPELRIGIG